MSKFNSNESYDSLSATQKGRFNSLYSIFKEDTISLVLLIEGRGENSFSKVVKKVDMLSKASHDEQKYTETMYEAFELDTVYTSQKIVSIVSDVRRELGLNHYVSSIQKNCDRDFFNIFIVQTEFQTNEVTGKKAIIGYRPIFKLKPED
jgi:hypothetical protein